MRLGQTRRAAHGRTFHHDRGIRRLRSRNDTEYLLASPANAAWIMRALDEVRGWREHLRDPNEPGNGTARGQEE